MKNYRDFFRALLLVPVVVLTLTACESVTDFGDMSASVDAGTASLYAALGDDETIMILDEDGMEKTSLSADEYVEIAKAGGQGVALVLTGSATFSNNVEQLRLNIRQTADGTTTGKGTVTIRGQSSEFETACVKPLSGFGHTAYGITLHLNEPYNFFGNKYPYVAVSITSDGYVVPGQVMNVRPFCGGSVVRFQPENRLTGEIQVINTDS
jgi:hypothetical protein